MSVIEIANGDPVEMDTGTTVLAKVETFSSKESDKTIIDKKAAINFSLFMKLVEEWLEKRQVLKEADSNFRVLASLILGEITEVEEAKQKTGVEYLFKNEAGELVDVVFFFISLIRLLSTKYNEQIDHEQALIDANGQLGGSNTFDVLSEVAGNISEQHPNILKRDAEYLLTLIFSYMLHMGNHLDPTKILTEYTIPKNSGNYPEIFMNGSNPFFEQKYFRKMNKEERSAYLEHAKKALRIIRKFIKKHVDQSVEHTGLKPKHYEPYKMFIYNFISGLGTGLTPEQALDMLKNQLYKDFNIIKPIEESKILVATR